MSVIIGYLVLLFAPTVFAEAIIVPHGTLKSFGNSQNTLTGVATPSLGATQSEIWHSSIGVGLETPLHTHEAEEIVILLAGKLQATVENNISNCDAPCTIILPANKSHVLKNIGEIPTSHYLVMPIKSKILDADNNEMTLPWRK